MIDWQPIETAPFETPVLVYIPGLNPLVYVCEKHQTVRHGAIWFEAAGEEYQKYDPTHWMPLPDPPEQKPLYMRAFGTVWRK